MPPLSQTGPANYSTVAVCCLVILLFVPAIIFDGLLISILYDKTLVKKETAIGETIDLIILILGLIPPVLGIYSEFRDNDKLRRVALYTAIPMAIYVFITVVFFLMYLIAADNSELFYELCSDTTSMCVCKNNTVWAEITTKETFIKCQTFERFIFYFVVYGYFMLGVWLAFLVLVVTGVIHRQKRRERQLSEAIFGSTGQAGIPQGQVTSAGQPPGTEGTPSYEQTPVDGQPTSYGQPSGYGQQRGP